MLWPVTGNVRVAGDPSGIDDVDGGPVTCEQCTGLDDDVINVCTNFTNVVIRRIMRVDESKGGCNSSKIKDIKV